MNRLLGVGMRRSERARFLVSLYGAFALSAVVLMAASQRQPAVAPASAEQMVINAQQAAGTDALAFRVRMLENMNLESRVTKMETAIEGLTWSTRTNYIVAITLLLNLVATLYQMRAGKSGRRDEK